MNIQPIQAFLDNYIWCVIFPDQTCIVVDPGEADPVLAFLDTHKLSLLAILITHKHHDHTGGIRTLVQATSAKVYGPPLPFVDQIVGPSDTISINSHCHFNVLAIPGHTLEHLAFVSSGIAFTGDTLFTAGCGRIFEGTAELMYQSLQTLNSLPGETLIYCGHEYTEQNLRFANVVEPNNPLIQQRLRDVQQLRHNGQPTVPAALALERDTNPFLRCEHPDVVAAAIKHHPGTLATATSVFATLRDWKNHYS